MKRKLILTLLAAMGLVILSAGIASAALAVYTVTLSQVAANYQGYYTFYATDSASGFPANTGFFIADNCTGMVKAEYAAALTAWSNGGKAIIVADPVTTVCLSVAASN
jgi:uncharacterized protein (DUF2141 family)